jgi:hypothetical protein
VDVLRTAFHINWQVLYALLSSICKGIATYLAAHEASPAADWITAQEAFAFAWAYPGLDAR